MADQSNKTSVLPPWGLDAGSDNEPTYTGADVAKLFSGLFTRGKGNTVPKPGRLAGMAIGTSGTKNIYVSDGTCLVPIGSNVGLCGLRESVYFTPGAKHATFDRLDRVYLEVADTAGKGRGGKLIYKEGTPAASPSAPSVPSNAVDLGIVKVPATGAISIAAQGPTTALNVPDGPIVDQSSVSGSFKGSITTIRLGGVATVIFNQVDITFPTGGMWEVSLPRGWNGKPTVGQIYCWSGKLPEFFQAQVSGDKLRVFGPDGQAFTSFYGSITYPLSNEVV